MGALLLVGPLTTRFGAAAARAVARSQGQAPRVREFVVTASNYRFAPARIEVMHDDIVKVELVGEDQAHAFAIDEYRIVKRVMPGQRTSFEFRADRPGTFSYYCSIAADPGCQAMRGTLAVIARS